MKPGQRRLLAGGAALAATAFGCSAALAHHPMGGAVPATAWQGALSGLAHPIIGLDHLAFLLGAALLAAWSGLRSSRAVGIALLFALAGAAGTWLRAGGWNSPVLDLGVAASLLVLAGLAVSSPRSGPLSGLRSGPWIWPSSAIAAGVAHGFAFGEAVVGAESTPLLSYLLGLALIEAALLVSGFAAGRWILRSRPHLLAVSRRSVAAAAAAAGALALLVPVA